MGAHKFNPFARGNDVPPPSSLDAQDAFGRPLHKGDMVALAQPTGLMAFRVADLKPNLDPSAPPNTMTVTLLAHLPMTVRANQPTAALVRVLSAAEVGLEVKDRGDATADEKATTLVTE